MFDNSSKKSFCNLSKRIWKLILKKGLFYIFYIFAFFFKDFLFFYKLNVPPLHAVAKFGTNYSLLKIKILAKRKRELTTKLAIARNGCLAVGVLIGFYICFCYFWLIFSFFYGIICFYNLYIWTIIKYFYVRITNNS